MSSITCYFDVPGHGFDPATLTDALGVEPTKTWRIGETTRRSGRPYKHDGWSITSEEMESRDVQEVALPILKRVLPVAGALVDFCAGRHLETVVWATPGGRRSVAWTRGQSSDGVAAPGDRGPASPVFGFWRPGRHWRGCPWCCPVQGGHQLSA